MLAAATAGLKILAALAGLFLAYKIQGYIRGWYQKWVDTLEAKRAREAREKAQADREKYNEGVDKDPRRPSKPSK